ncbi:flagellar filament capping protein FliD [Paenibacillus sp. KN14-4R]|uniref:flagellar filament capping protein FliD n=1 Tax=Paenibacillus sp. KN14-4R TaxID=3445773 RepID=UPI003F9FCD4F
MVERISGLASGMNTEDMIAKLMRAQREPVNRLFQKKQSLQWEREAYRSINSKILDFHDNKLHKYRLEGTFSSRSTSVTGADASAISAKANTNAATGSFAIAVGGLATAANVQSNVGINAAGKTIDPTKSLESQNKNFGSDPVAALKNSSFDSAKPVSDTNREYLPQTINGVQIDIDPTKDSLNDVINKINSKTNVNAYFDATTGKISLVSKETGLVNGANKNADTIDVNGAFLTDSLQLTKHKEAVNADVTINGIKTTRTSNTFDVNGTTITINGKTTGPVTVTSGVNEDDLISKVKDFVKDYNEMLKALQDQVSEAKYRAFKPLTDDQRKEMKEDEIKKWEEKAKSGTLKNNDILNDAISKLRLITISRVEGDDAKYNTLASIGITSTSYMDNGKLYVDEQKLKDAIKANPDAIAQIFTAKGNGDKDVSDVGIAKRMYDEMQSTLSKIKDRAGSAFVAVDASDDSPMGKQFFRLNNDIKNGNTRLKQIEERYYKQFSAMESAMSKLQAQGSNLLSQFGGGK